MARVVNFVALNAVTATGASQQQDTFGSDNISMVVDASSVTVGATVEFQASADGTNWFTIDTRVVSGDGITIDNDQNFHKLVRANVTAYTDGTYTVTIQGNAKGGVA